MGAISRGRSSSRAIFVATLAVLAACGSSGESTQAKQEDQACRDAVDGTSCGSGLVCVGGACSAACIPSTLCETGNACTVGSTTCASPWSAPACAVAGQKPDGTPCGNGQLCSAGACATPSTVARVWVADAVAVVGGTASLTAEVTVGSGSPSLEVDWTTDGCPGAWVSPARGVATTFHAPAAPAKCRVRATSVADPSKSDLAYVVVENPPVLPPIGVAVGGEPYDVSTVQRSLGTVVLIVASTRDGTVQAILPEDGSILDSWYVGANPRGAMSTDGYRGIWVTLTGENKVARLNGYYVMPHTGLVEKFDVGSMPHGLVVTDAAVWVANYGSDTLTKLDPWTGALLGTVPIGAWGHRPTGVAYDGATLWVSTSTAVLNLTTAGQLIRSIPANDAYGLATDGAYVWFSNHAGNTVVRVDKGNGATATFTVGNRPLGIAPTGAGSVWVANTGDDTVSEVRTADGAILATLKTGSLPYDVLFYPLNGSLWVTNYGDGDVHRLF